MADRMDRLGRLYATRFCLTRLAGAQVYLRWAPLAQKRLHIGISVNGRICCFTELKTQTRLLHNDFRQTSSLKCPPTELLVPLEFCCPVCVSHIVFFSFSSTMSTLSQTKELFRSAEAVCFDVDSTVIKEEGIDELAKFCGVGDAVTEMCVYAVDIT